jgi:hypothetical protein
MANRDFPQLEADWNVLDAAGIPLEPLECRVGIDAKNSRRVLTLRAGRDLWRCEIRELKNGQFAFIAPIFTRRNRPGKTIILDAWIGTSWPDTSIELLEDPAFEEKHPGYYNLPGDTERFLREEVVNHRIINTTLTRGGICAGLLLAVGSRPPDHYKNHDKVPISITVVDQWDVPRSVTLQARMNRRPARVAAVTRSTRGPLLSHRDVIVPDRGYATPRDSSAESPEKQAEEYRSIIEDIARFRSEHNAGMPVAPKARGH